MTRSTLLNTGARWPTSQNRLPSQLSRGMNRQVRHRATQGSSGSYLAGARATSAADTVASVVSAPVLLIRGLCRMPTRPGYS